MVGRRGVCRDRTGSLPSSTLASCTLCFNGRWFILALLMELSPLPLLLERPRGERSRLPLMAQASGARSSATTLKPERPLEILEWNLLGSYCCQQLPQTQPNTHNQTNRRALTKLCFGQAAQNKLSSCAADTGLHFLFLSCHLSHTGRQRLQVSS